MQFLSSQECEKWLHDRQRGLPHESLETPAERIPFPTEPYRYFFFARWIAKSLTFELPALLWINEWEIWPNSENWHLYYTLRQSNHTTDLLEKSPGHLFLGYETEALCSFLQLAMLNGWDGYLLTQADHVNLFFSHDEYIDFFGRNYDLGEILKALGSHR